MAIDIYDNVLLVYTPWRFAVLVTWWGRGTVPLLGVGYLVEIIENGMNDPLLPNKEEAV